jgi:hypothetical protein
MGLSEQLMNQKIHFKKNDKFQGRNAKCPFFIPTAGITVKDSI